jgi:hypothetical protein
MSALNRPVRSARPPRAQRRYQASLESLESRTLLSGSAPTDAEQYMLELINRARANPSLEGQRLLNLAQSNPVIRQATAGWNLSLFYQTISSYSPEPPLAFDPRLIDAALAEDSSMLAQNSQTHSPTGFLNNPSVAVDTDGQAYFPTNPGWWATGENIFAFSENVTGTVLSDYADYFEAGFLIDWGNSDFGHLKNILAPGPAEANAPAGVYPFNQVGIGLLTGTPTTPPDPNPENLANAGLNVGPVLVTQEFGWTQGTSFLTGTFYNDNAGTQFYEPGEGIGGINITAVGTSGQGTFQTQTWSTGGYSLELPPGTYKVSATGSIPNGVQSTVVTIGQDNVGWGAGFTASQQAPIPVTGDYDGVGHAELATYQPSTGVWTIDGPTGTRTVNFGIPGDIPVPGRYDGGSTEEIAVYRPSTGLWFILSPTGERVVSWGIPGDIPVPGDYDGDGKTDEAVYRPSVGVWFILESKTQTVLTISWGIPNLDQPVPATYDGGKFTEIAVLRPTSYLWFIDSRKGERVVQDGSTGDIPAPAPYDGGNQAEVAVYQPSNASFLVANRGITQFLGVPGLDQPVIGDFDGDGKADLAVFQPSTASWFVNLSNGGTIQTQYGQSGISQTLKSLVATSFPVPAAWVTWAADPAAEDSGGFVGFPVTDDLSTIEEIEPPSRQERQENAEREERNRV